MSPETVAYMANQTGRSFAHQDPDQAMASIATHLRVSWDPRMRRDILAHLDDAPVQLDPLAHEAIGQLKERATA